MTLTRLLILALCLTVARPAAAFTAEDVEQLLFQALDADDPAVRDAVLLLKKEGLLTPQAGTILEGAYMHGGTLVVQAANVLRRAGLISMGSGATGPSSPPASSRATPPPAEPSLPPTAPQQLTLSGATQLVLSAIDEVGGGVGYPTKRVESSSLSGTTAFIQVKRNGFGPLSRPFVFEVDTVGRRISRVYQIDVWGNPMDDWSHVYSGRGTI